MKQTILNKSRITEVDATSVRMISAYKTSSMGSDEHLNKLFTQLEERSNALTEAINPSKSLSELEVKDELRDESIRVLYHLITAAASYPDAEVRAAGDILQKVFDRYGMSIITENYASESSLVNSMLKDFAQADNEEAIAKVPGIATVISALEETQRDFETARAAYERIKSVEDKKSNATEIKAEVLHLINHKIVRYVSGMTAVLPSVYSEFEATLDKIIATNNEAVRKRKGRPVPIEQQ